MESDTGTSGSSTGILASSDIQCDIHGGGDEFGDNPLRLRFIKNSDGESYKMLAHELEELGNNIPQDAHRQIYRPSARYISDVVLFDSDYEGDRIINILRERSRTYPGKLFGYVRERDHIHIIHDCTFSSGCCRCAWQKEDCIRAGLRRNLRRRRFIKDLDEVDWLNIFIYFIMRKWESPKEIWINGVNRKLPDDDQNIRWGHLQERAREVLDRQNEGNRYDYKSEGQGSSEDMERRRPNIFKRSQEPETKRSKFGRYFQEISTLLNKYNVIPADQLRDIIPINHTDYNIEYFNPINSKYYDSACSLYTQNYNMKNFIDLYFMYEFNEPVFYAHNINPFVYYHSREESFNYINNLLLFQNGGNEDKVKELLINIKYWFDKKGWWINKITPNGIEQELNNKINCVIILGPPNSGKNYFWDMLAALSGNVGHIGRVNNKTNQFALQDTYNKRLIMGNEISMEEGAKEDFKKLCEGTAFNIRVKFQGDKIFTKTPVCLISNNSLDIATDPHFRNIRCVTLRWQTCNFLKESKKKPYPLVLYDIYSFYNISLDTIDM